MNYCIEHEVVNVEDITYSHVRQYLLGCQDKGNQAGTINTKLLRIRAFLNYIVECEVIKNNPAKKVKMQKNDVKIDVFSDEQIKQMLNFYRRIKHREKSYVAYRDYMVIVTILGTGIRRGEVINLKWSDVDFINKSISVFGKSRRKETIPITDKLAKELGGYQTFCKQYWGNISEYVFVKRDNTQMTDKYYGKRYERNPENRKKAIEINGLSCVACGFNFEEVYGERGKDFIEVHHVKPLSTIGEKVVIDPKEDLVPVCSNCHRMIHRRKDEVLTVEELKTLMNNRKLTL